jgi:hypothetical protein
MGSLRNPLPEAQTKLRVGFAQAPIDASPGLPMGGYARRSGVALGTAEPLLATAVAFLAGGRRCVIVSLDLVAVTTWVSRHLRNALSRFGLDDECLILAATHTHSSPGEDQRKLVADDLYYGPAALEAIERAVANAVEIAIDTAVEAELQAAGGLIEGIAASRVPGGATLPPTGSLVLARSTSGELLGAIVGYAAHPTVLGEDNLYYSPDYVGPFRTALRRQLQEVPIVFLNGASGDLSTRSTRRARTLEENDRLGTALAAQFSALVNGARPIESTPLVTGAVSFEVRARSFPPAAEIDTVLGVARDRYRKAVDAENDLIGAEALASLAASARDRRETATLRAVRIGDVAVIGVPAELFSELGNAIAKPRHVTILIIATCADGYLSYILPSQMAREAHYEALVSWVTPETGEQLVTAANQLVSKVVAEN